MSNDKITIRELSEDPLLTLDELTDMIRQLVDGSETPSTIVKWAKETFGVSSDPAVYLDRAREEWDELCQDMMDYHRGKVSRKDVALEAADVAIILCQVVDALGYDLWELVEFKMQLNRLRVWKTTSAGTGQHV